MKQKTRLLAMLLAGMIVLAGCSRPAADTPAENDDPAPEQQEQQEEQPQEDPSQSEQQEPDQQPEQLDEETADEQTEETDEQTDEEETSADAGQQDEAGARQGCYRLFDSGFEITVEDPFYIAYDELMGTMQVTIPDEPAFQAYIYYDPTGQTMDQLESSIKTLEESYEGDPTVSNMQTQVDEQENGLFSISFSYSAGATEGSRRDFTLSITKRPRRACLQPTSTATVPAIPRRSAAGQHHPAGDRERAGLPDRAGVAAWRSR